MVSTSLTAFKLARKLCDELEGRKLREKELNLKKEGKTNAQIEPSKEGPSRTVTEIDYHRHEQTVKELDRQEKEERFQKKKQEASQWCTLDHEHGPNCRRQVGGCSHDHQKEWAIYERSTEEKVKAADRFRQEGNEAYNKHNYGLAAVHYRKALLQFDYTFAEGDVEERAVDEVKVRCLLNLAACKCQQEEWDEVLTQCRLALEINPRSVKAFYRTGLAHLARDQFELAKDALMSAHEIEPKNGEVVDALKRLKQSMANYKVRRKEVFREMMSGGGEEPGGEAEAAAVREPPPAVAVPPLAVPPADGGAAPRVAEAEGAGAAEPAAAGRVAALLREADGAAVGAGELRRRRGSGLGGPEAEDEDDEGEAEDEVLSGSQRRMLNYILLGAVGLAVTSLSVCAVAYLSEANA